MNIYYINLDRSPKRDELMRLQLQRNTDIKFKRVRAVDGSDTRDLGNHLIINNTYFRDRLFAWGGNRMQTTSQKRQSIICIQKQLACLVSHLLAIKEAYNDGLNEAIILEDDVDLTIFNAISNEFREILGKFKDETNIIQLFTSSEEMIPFYKGYIVNKNIQVLKRNPNLWGCCGYLIKKTGMENIMKYYDKKLNKFNLSQFNGAQVNLISEKFIYNVADKDTILSLPLLNILDPIYLPSTIATDIKYASNHINIHKFVNMGKEQIITVIKSNELIS